MALYSKLLGIVGTSFAIGVTGVAASGALRVANNVTALAARNAAGSGDLSLVGTDGSNNLLLGDTNTASILFGPASIGWGAGVASPGISQAAALSDVATKNLTITSQAPFASAVTNVKGGSIILKVPGSISGNPNGYVNMQWANSSVGAIGFSFGGATNANTYASVWAGVTPANTNFIIQTDTNFLFLNAPVTNSKVTVAVAQSIVFVASAPANTCITFFNGNTFINGSGSGVMGVGNATTDPSTSPTAGSIWWSSLTVGASKQRTSSGWTKTTCGNTSTTKSTQLALDDEIPAFASITTSGNTLVVNVPLATSLSNVTLEVDVAIKIAVAGSANAAGDAFALCQLGTWKNVAGTVSRVGALPAALHSVADASLNTSTVVITTSGTNVVITITVNASSGTLGTADVTCRARALYN